MGRTIAIVGGTGPEGRGLAFRWTRAGEDVIIGSRDATRAAETARELNQRIGTAARLCGAENTQAVAAADVIVLTVPFSAQVGILKSLKKAFRPGSILIDVTVPLAASIGGQAGHVLGVWQGSAAQQAAELAPKEVAVAAAFHNVSAELLNSEGDVDCDVLICTDDDRARQVARELAEKIPGTRAVDAGRLENARIVEQITALLITINQRQHVHRAGLRITGLA